MARYNRLLTVIRGSLKNMALALRGLLVMSGELEAAFNSIALNQVGSGASRAAAGHACMHASAMQRCRQQYSTRYGIILSSACSTQGRRPDAAGSGIHVP